MEAQSLVSHQLSWWFSCFLFKKNWLEAIIKPTSYASGFSDDEKASKTWISAVVLVKLKYL